MTFNCVIHFDKGVDCQMVAEALRSLPQDIGPDYFCVNEGSFKRTDRIVDTERFHLFLQNNQIGFFLYSENGFCFDVASNGDSFSSVAIYSDALTSAESYLSIMRHLSQNKPIFGYLCDEKEYEHRNRHFITIGGDQIESWIGRDLSRSVPGLYWMTLVSDSFLALHSVPLERLAVEAQSSEVLGDGSVRLLKFFDRPESWIEHSQRLDDACANVDGIFSRRKVDAAVAGVSSYLEFDEIMSEFE